VFFRAGSRNERRGETGIAHLFEHMMFNGGKRFGPGVFDDTIEINGGSTNGYTTRDYTAYLNNFPREALPIILDLESDRMANLAITPQNLQQERGIVMEERRLRIDNDVGGSMNELLYLQAFDYHGTNTLPYARLDYRRLVQWLHAILELDPRSEYPLMAAARVYAETADVARSRIALDFVYREFPRDPPRRWQWLAHAALLAKHRLHDLALARQYAAAVEANTRDLPGVPLWAKQMQIFILEDMNELEAARIMLGGLLESGAISDPEEARYLELHLRALERRSARPR